MGQRSNPSGFQMDCRVAAPLAMTRGKRRVADPPYSPIRVKRGTDWWLRVMVSVHMPAGRTQRPRSP